MTIYGKTIILRAIEKEDLPILQVWNNDPDIQYHLGGWHFPASLSIMENWFESIQDDELNKRFAICVDGIGIIGTTNLVNINWKDRNAFTGLMIGEQQHRSKGYGTDTVMTIMKYAFQELGLERLDTTIIEHNEASLHLYIDRCGWKEEGRKKNWYWRDNRYWEKIILGINRDEYFTFVGK